MNNIDKQETIDVFVDIMEEAKQIEGGYMYDGEFFTDEEVEYFLMNIMQ